MTTATKTAERRIRIRPYPTKDRFGTKTLFLLSYQDAAGAWHNFPGTFTDRAHAKRQGVELTR